MQCNGIIFYCSHYLLRISLSGVVHGATFIDAVVDEVGEEDAEHHHDEDRAEDQEEVLVHVELILSVDHRSLLVGEVVKHLNKNICRK